MARFIASPDFDRFALVREITEKAKPSDDSATPSTEGLYKPETGEALLRAFWPTVRAHAGTDIWPTNSFARVVFNGGELQEHVDRPGLDWTVSINVCRDEPWYIEANVDGEWLRFNDGKHAVLMEGIKYPHRRPVYCGKYAYQLFLHYCTDQRREGDNRFDE